jgi:hypothetical protein
VPDLDLVALLQPLRRVDPAAVQPGAVLRVKVLDIPEAVRDLEPRVVAGGEVVQDDQGALAPGGEVGVEDVPVLAHLDLQGLARHTVGQGHPGLPGDRGYGRLPGLLLRLGGFVPRRERPGVGGAMRLISGLGEVVQAGAAHISMMPERTVGEPSSALEWPRLASVSLVP